MTHNGAQAACQNRDGPGVGGLFSRRTLLKSAGLSFIGGLTVLQGCSSPSNSAIEPIRVGVATRVQMLDPRRATDALSSRINRLIYRQLVDFNDRFEPVPDLADWQALSATHYRFTLLETPFFHDGTPLNAHDVAATYQSVMDPGFGSAHRASLKNIRKIDVVNAKQLDFTLYEPDPLFVGRLVIGIVPKALIEAGHAFHEQPLGSGPCRFVSMSEQKLSLQRTDGVHLEFVAVKDATVRVLKLKKGELDLVQNDLSPELVAYSQQQPELQVDWHSGSNFGYIGFNFEDPLLAQPALRQAIAHGIDRKAVIEAVFAGRARLAGGLLAPEHWCGVPEIEGYAYDPQRARDLLKHVQIPPGLVNSEGLLELSYKTSNDPTRIRLATVYQSQLRKIGIQLKIQSYDWGTFYSDIKQGRFQLYSLAWVGIKSPDIFRYVFDSEAVPPKGANRGRYQDARADRLIREADQSQDPQRQADLYRQLQRHLQDTLAVLPLWYEDQYAVYRHAISGYRLYADGRLDGLLTVNKSPSSAWAG